MTEFKKGQKVRVTTSSVRYDERDPAAFFEGDILTLLRDEPDEENEFYARRDTDGQSGYVVATAIEPAPLDKSGVKPGDTVVVRGEVFVTSLNESVVKVHADTTDLLEHEPAVVTPKPGYGTAVVGGAPPGRSPQPGPAVPLPGGRRDRGPGGRVVGLPARAEVIGQPSRQ
jgi:hypothetical protein